jgi:ribosomal-protein-alanine N-acetyltransferase
VPFQNLHTEDLILRPLTQSDVKVIFQLSQEASLVEWLPDQVYKNEAEAAEVVDFLVSQYAPTPQPDIRPFVVGVELKETRELIGHVGLSPLTEGEIEIGYAIAQEATCKGYGTQAVAALSQWAISDLKLPKIHGIVACENVGSGRVLEKAGYTLESELDHYYLGKIRPCRRYFMDSVRS